jgi:hypothetical protein
MKLKEKIGGWYRTEKAKLGPMTPKKRAGYILHYYRWWFAGAALLIAIILLIANVVVQGKKQTVLEGFYTNDEWNLFDAQHIEQEYGAQLNLTKMQRVVLDDGLYIDLGGSASDYTAASNGKIIAYMATGELDFVVTTRPVLDHFNGQVPMKDLAEVLPPDLLDQLKDQLVTGKDANGKEIYIALDMTKSRYVAGVGAADDPAVTDTYYMFVPYNAPHTQAIADYIRYCFDTQNTAQ